LQSRQETAELDERLDVNQRRPKAEVCAVRAEHPGWQRADRVIRKLAEDVFAVTIPFSLLHPQRLTEQRVPAVVDGNGLKMMCIMLLIRPASAKRI
jgi:hypothetical protein